MERNQAVLSSRKDLCPGCGAKFQHDDQDKPGFIPVSLVHPELDPATSEKRSKHRKQALTVEDLQSSTKDTASTATSTASTVESTTANIDVSPDALSESVKNMDPETLQKLFLGTSSSSSPPASASSVPDDKKIVCKRCFDLKHYNRVIGPVGKPVVPDVSFLSFLRDARAPSVVVVVCDLYDLPFSLLPDVGKLISSHHKLILVANKVDLLPKDVHHDRLEQWLIHMAKIQNFPKPDAIHLISAKSNLGITELAKDIAKYYKQLDKLPAGLNSTGLDNSNVYFVGRANVGKSMVVNALLKKSFFASKHAVTTSPVPGTTIEMFGIPLNVFSGTITKRPVEYSAQKEDTQASTGNKKLATSKAEDHGVREQDAVGGAVYDTPGIAHRASVLDLLTPSEIVDFMPRNARIKTQTFHVKVGQTISFGPFGQIDYVSGPHKLKLFTVCSHMQVHIGKAEAVANMHENMRAEGNTKSILVHPLTPDPERLKRLPELVTAAEFELSNEHINKASYEVGIAGVGWISAPLKYDGVVVRVRTLKGLEGSVFKRNAMLPFEYHGKATRRLQRGRKTD
ncbi:hypothetical protein GQ42DRAFT_180702 [Ramicandelaber brevisporus]|nr:hypothetical protein GQ42DRAFT_180702 [Ramicandelaber brevisporus]